MRIVATLACCLAIGCAAAGDVAPGPTTGDLDAAVASGW